MNSQELARLAIEESTRFVGILHMAQVEKIAKAFLIDWFYSQDETISAASIRCTLDNATSIVRRHFA